MNSGSFFNNIFCNKCFQNLYKKKKCLNPHWSLWSWYKFLSHNSLLKVTKPIHKLHKCTNFFKKSPHNKHKKFSTHLILHNFSTNSKQGKNFLNILLNSSPLPIKQNYSFATRIFYLNNILIKYNEKKGHWVQKNFNFWYEGGTWDEGGRTSWLGMAVRLG